MASTQQPVTDLINLLADHPALKDALEISLKEAALPHLNSLDKLYEYLNNILTHIPSEHELMPGVREFYHALSKSPDDILKKERSFNDWINSFVRARGNFLDSPESIETLHSYIACADYKIDDYIKGPSGWLTYNQFLARQLKPGLRPVAELCNNSVIVSPTDSEYMGAWQIAENSTVKVKGVDYSVKHLLKDSSFNDRFSNGIFTHSFLAITDYHRFHMPVGGIIREVNVIPADTWVTTEKKEDGSIENVDDVGFQFEHTRGYIIIDSEVGLVAVIPVGMGHISSVNLTRETGRTLVKDEEFGFFGFGGSDIIMLFEKDRVMLTGEKGKHYKYGEEIGRGL